MRSALTRQRDGVFRPFVKIICLLLWRKGVDTMNRGARAAQHTTGARPIVARARQARPYGRRIRHLGGNRSVTAGVTPSRCTGHQAVTSSGRLGVIERESARGFDVAVSGSRHDVNVRFRWRCHGPPLCFEFSLLLHQNPIMPSVGGASLISMVWGADREPGNSGCPLQNSRTPTNSSRW